MKKLIIKLSAAFLMLVIALTLTPTSAYADVDLLVKDKTNKLVLGDNMDECYKAIEETSAAGKSITYKINVPKGLLYFRIADYTDFKVEIYNSENEVVEEFESVTNVLYGDIALASGGVDLSKGKYKIKISPKDKNSELNTAGIVAMLKNSTSRTISVNQQYSIPVKEGKTYKIKFTIEDAVNNKDMESKIEIKNAMQMYDPNEIVPYIPEYQVLNSKGKKVIDFTNFGDQKSLIVENGTYTLVFKAKKTGMIITTIDYEKRKIIYDLRDIM